MINISIFTRKSEASAGEGATKIMRIIRVLYLIFIILIHSFLSHAQTCPDINGSGTSTNGSNITFEAVSEGSWLLEYDVKHKWYTSATEGEWVKDVSATAIPAEGRLNSTYTIASSSGNTSFWVVAYMDGCPESARVEITSTGGTNPPSSTAPTITPSGIPLDVCKGSVFSLATGEYTSYSWLFYTEDKIENAVEKGTLQTYEPTESGYYWVKVNNDPNLISSSIPVTFVDPRVLNVTISDPAESGPICNGETIRLDAEVSPNYAANSFNYQWKVNGISVGPNQNYYERSVFNNLDKIVCEITLKSGETKEGLCIDDDFGVSDEEEFEITSLPDKPIVSGHKNQCGETDLEITAVMVTPNVGSNVTYNWFMSDGTDAAGGTFISKQYGEDQTTGGYGYGKWINTFQQGESYFVSATNECGNSDIQNFTIYIEAAPGVQATAYVCNPSNLTPAPLTMYFNNAPDGSTFDIYRHEFDEYGSDIYYELGSTSSNTFTYDQFYQPYSNEMYVVVNNASLCGISDNYISVYVENIFLDEPTVLGSREICEETNLELTMADNGKESYRWYANLNEEPILNQQSYIKENTKEGFTIYATYTSSGNIGTCESPVATVNISIIDLLPDPPFVLIINKKCGIGDLEIVAYGDFSQYQWYDKDGQKIGDDTDKHSVNLSAIDDPVILKVKGIRDNGCESDVVELSAVAVENCENYVHETTVNVAGAYDENGVKALNIAVGQKAETWNYFDGLGRGMQVVQQQASPAGRDVVQPIIYDAFGRQNISYLPYVLNETAQDAQAMPGMYKENPVNHGVDHQVEDYNLSPQYEFYANHFNATVDKPEFPYSEKRFEASPLNRVMAEAAPGDKWHFEAKSERQKQNRDWEPIDLHTQITYDYRSNGVDEVRLWTVDMNNTLHNDYHKLESTGWYAENELYLNVVRDEHGNLIYEYKDKQGQVVLKKAQVAEESDLGVHDGWACTYYVYDDFGNLRYVIPPQAVQEMVIATGGPDWTLVQDASFIDNWMYYYSYDGRQRMTTKKVPGAGLVYMVYDQRDRLVLTQDGNQRSTEFGADNSGTAWSFSKYDVLNRPVMSGIYIHDVLDESQAAMQGYVNDRAGLTLNGEDFAWYESRNESDDMHGYDNASFPKINAGGTDLEVLSVTYYDDYSFLNNEQSARSYFEASLKNFAFSHPDADANVAVKGLACGSKVKVLDPQAAADNYLSTVSYYDDRYRPVQSITENHLGEMETQTSWYNDLTANIVKSLTRSTMQDTPEVERTFAYDHAKRLETVKHTIDGGTEVTLIENEYNELGELIEKNLHQEGDEEAWQSVDYRYNIRGWLTHINDAVLAEEEGDLFGMELYYADPRGGFEHQAYNGNISGVKWKSAVDKERMAYGYQYDKLNRIISAHYAAGTAPIEIGATLDEDKWQDEGYYNMEIIGAQISTTDKYESGYDLNGNIKFLHRDGFESSMNAPGHLSPIDRLTYDYDGTGNQLNKVSDAGTDGGFKDGTNTGNDYIYDDNGNMIVDENKGITDIEYNLLNLPAVVHKEWTKYKTDGSVDAVFTGKIEYLYDAAGIKLAQQVYEDVSTPIATKTTDYIGARVYESNATETQALQFIHHEEGRIVPGPDVNDLYWTPNSKDWEYQYHIKDHLGNTRVTFADPLVEYLATMEEDATTRAIEEGDPKEIPGALGFDNINETDEINTEMDHTSTVKDEDGNKIYPNAHSVSLLTGVGDRIVGPAISLQVMPGDKVDISVFYKYAMLAPQTTNEGVTADALMLGFNNAFAEIGGELLIAGSNLDGGFLKILVDLINAENSTDVPDAYLNYIIADENYQNAVGKKLMIQSEGDINKGDKHGKLEHSISFDKAGYVYIYLSNLTENSMVGFDDLLITHKPNNIIQKDDYYPFGMSIAGLNFSRENTLENDFLYNGKELQRDLGLDWYDYGARMYDSEIGRWGVVDPLADQMRRHSPYNYAFDNPLLFIDPDGMRADKFDQQEDDSYEYEEDEYGSDVITVNLKDGSSYYIINGKKSPTITAEQQQEINQRVLLAREKKTSTKFDFPGGIAGSGPGGDRNPTGMTGKHANIEDWSGLVSLLSGGSFGKFSLSSLDPASGLSKVLSLMGLGDEETSDFNKRKIGVGKVWNKKERKYESDSLFWFENEEGHYIGVGEMSRLEKDSVKDNSVSMPNVNKHLIN